MSTSGDTEPLLTRTQGSPFDDEKVDTVTRDDGVPNITVHRDASTVGSSNEGVVLEEDDDDEDGMMRETSADRMESEKKKVRNTILGMILVAIGTLFICTVGAVAKNLSGHVSVFELLLGRYILQELISWMWWVCKRPNRDIAKNWYGDSPYKINIWLRGFLYWTMIFCYWRGLSMVPIGDAEAIFFLAPLMTVIAARVYLKEKLPKVFFLTFFLTIFGVVFICQPAFVFSNNNNDYEPISWIGLLFLLGADFSWASVCILVRTAKEAHWLQLELVSSLQAAFIWTPLLLFLNRIWFHSNNLEGGTWVYNWETFGSIAIMSVLGFLGLMCSVIGYQIGDATKVAWMEYLDLVFAFIYQWFAFDDEPNVWEFTGCAFLFGVCFVHVGEEGVKYFYKKYQHKKVMQRNEIEQKMLDETSALRGDLLSKEKHQKKISKLHALDRIPENDEVCTQSTSDKLRAIFNRMTSFSTISDRTEEPAYEVL